MNPLLQNLSHYLQSAQCAALCLDAMLKSLVVLALAGGVCALWRRASAATRHLIWFLAVASLPLLPLLNAAHLGWQKPAWTVSRAAGSGNQLSLALEFAPQAASPSAATAPDAPAVGARGSAHQAAARFSARWLWFASVAWLAGAAFAAMRVTAARFSRRKFSRRARPWPDADCVRLLQNACESLRLRRPVTLLQSPDTVMPMTWGWLRPMILLPGEAAHWPEARRRVVLLHELAHVQRRDCLTQIIAQIVCALYWFNPLSGSPGGRCPSSASARATTRCWPAAARLRTTRATSLTSPAASGACRKRRRLRWRAHPAWKAASPPLWTRRATGDFVRRRLWPYWRSLLESRFALAAAEPMLLTPPLDRR